MENGIEQNPVQRIEGDRLSRMVSAFAEDVEDPEMMVQLGAGLATSVLASTPPLLDQTLDLAPGKMMTGQVSNGINMFECLIGKFDDIADKPLVGLRLVDMQHQCVVSFAVYCQEDRKLYAVEFQDGPLH